MGRTFKKQYIQKNRSNQVFYPIGVVLHETATPGATAQNEFNFFNNNQVGASAHGFIDWIEDIQTIPWKEKAWHACEPANSKFVGIEMCRPKVHDVAKFNATYEAAVDAVARVFFYALKINKVTRDNLMSHDEVRIKWGRTTHTDPTGLFKEYGKTMDQFRADVQKRINARIS